MNQEKIGKYIQAKRKEKGITQQELASRLGVSEKTVSNWENGRNMPDLSLFHPLCEELNISINDLMNGEKVDNDSYQKKLEENMLNTINYSNKKTNKKIKRVIGLFMLLFIILFSFIIFNSYNHKLIEDDNYPVYKVVHLDNKELNSILNKYILDNILSKEGKVDEYHEEKNFTSFKIFSVEEKTNSNYYVYAWILERTYSYSAISEDLAEQSGASYPCRFEVKKDKDGFRVVNCDIPRDGNYYDKDKEIYFPIYVREEIDLVHDKNGVYDQLSDDILNQAKNYFNIE